MKWKVEGNSPHARERRPRVACLCHSLVRGPYLLIRMSAHLLINGQFFFILEVAIQYSQSLYKCYPYKHCNFIYDKKILLPYKNTIGKSSECYVLSVITYFTPFFVNYTSVSVNFEKIKAAIVCQCGSSRRY